MKDISEELKRNFVFPFEDIAALWKDINVCTDNKTMITVITAWEKLFSRQSLMRLLLILQQTSWSGLTTYKLIERALKEITSFPWVRLVMLINGDFINFQKAREAIGNDEYFAYGQEFSRAYSSKYKALGYACWKILKKSGDGQFNNYKGFENANITCKIQIDRLIEKWEVSRTGDDNESDKTVDLMMAQLISSIKDEELPEKFIDESNELDATSAMATQETSDVNLGASTSREPAASTLSDSGKTTEPDSERTPETSSKRSRPNVDQAANVSVRRTTVCEILSETTRAIWDTLCPIYLPTPTAQGWLEIAHYFERTWAFPNCIGTLMVCKHIRVQAARSTGFKNFNYKGYFSSVLLAMCDSRYCFTVVDRSPGRSSDGAIFADSVMASTVLLKVPEPTTVTGIGTMPHVIVGDAAFPLKENIMRPYPGQNLNKRQNF
ncbi:hypothetical protein GQR58_009292 [Nymphon striatum]|nr:hypothetical protein GQR58_009292 [Nymphon striatum]KAG1684828.1 hypothetical protein GQR58_009292 [Nymphon striatum]KAG1684830.1 hypothetical protein GQR58_009292 [Nymphon striatum]